MSIATEAGPTLREVILDSLHDAYWARQSNIEECPACAKQPAGVCACHQEDNDLSRQYEDARKQIEGSLAGPETAAELAGLFPAAAEGGETA
jgi:hypothetical protein